MVWQTWKAFRADALRLVDSHGAELLWAVTGPSGQAIVSGPIPAAATLSIPAVCAAHGHAEYYAYFDNPAAWSVPDFLPCTGSLRNGGVEEGQGDTPAAWTHDEGDGQHHAAWVAERAHAGKKCLKTIVAEGAAPTWISTRQSGIRIRGGGRYVVHGMGKGRKRQGLGRLVCSRRHVPKSNAPESHAPGGRRLVRLERSHRRVHRAPGGRSRQLGHRAPRHGDGLV